MGSFSDVLEVHCINHLLRTYELEKLPNLYVALHDGDPTDAALGTEISTVDTGYARQPIAVENASWTAPANMAGAMGCSNLVEVEWDAPEGDWGVPDHFSLWTAVTGGEMWIHGAIQGTLRAVGSTDEPVSLAPGAMTVTLGQDASDYLETAFLNHLLRTPEFTKLANVYWSLHEANPTEAGGVGEFTGTGYARVALAVADASWTTPALTGDDHRTENVNSILWPAPLAAWGTYNYIGCNDAASAGNLLFYTNLLDPRTVNASDQPPILLPGQMKFQWG